MKSLPQEGKGKEVRTPAGERAYERSEGKKWRGSPPRDKERSVRASVHVSVCDACEWCGRV